MIQYACNDPVLLNYVNEKAISMNKDRQLSPSLLQQLQVEKITTEVVSLEVNRTV